ncbi:extracellular solute-binding protein [Paenibacillus sp. 19GGS1-52]|uniref:extracellular solute-binding protein n=1 Tax=Paenibacillus sp. 19GGS1-52 TaxID=2758563 RepID=UPI001EFBBEC7|nr:extracellular solute-binding protein [Paenibacillus sp. 19GGS1-52]ULO07107.1 extracellular solute-binding protein [Paenibacillus sp. 19GGS1-52]
MKRRKLTTLLLGSILVLSACSNAADNTANNAGNNADAGKNNAETAVGKQDPYAPMAEQVTISIGKEAAVDPKLPSGSTVEDNELTRYFSEKLNIKYVDDWQATSSGDAYRQKVSLSLTGGDLPDVIVVDKQQLVQLVNADMLEDLTGVYENYVSPSLKAAYDSTNGYSLNSATFDGKLRAFPNVSPGADAENLLWVRQDWLDELNLPAPKTLDDIIAVTKAFQKKKGASGILGTQQIVNIGNSQYGFDTIFSAFDAYPELWVKDEQGKVVYGSIQPQMKEALAKLQDMVKEGLIDKEFAVKKPEQATELIVSGKAGIFFGPWWLPYSPLNDAVSQDSKAEWAAYLAPEGKEGKMNTHLAAASASYLVVRKGYEHPEAVLKTLNMQFDIDQLQGEGIVEMDPYQWMNMPFTLLLSNYDDKEKKALAVQSVIDGSAAVDTLQGEAKQVYESYLKDKETPKKDMAAWSQRNAFLTGALILAGDGVSQKQGVFYDQTDTMRGKWANLQKLEDETMLKIIMGSESVDYFDSFVEKWKSQGGDQITEEVEAQINK